MEKREDAATALSNLRKRVKQNGSIAETARAVGMPRSWLSRVLSPKTASKLEEVEEEIRDL